MERDMLSMGMGLSEPRRDVLAGALSIGLGEYSVQRHARFCVLDDHWQVVC